MLVLLDVTQFVGHGRAGKIISVLLFHCRSYMWVDCSSFLRFVICYEFQFDLYMTGKGIKEEMKKKRSQGIICEPSSKVLTCKKKPPSPPPEIGELLLSARANVDFCQTKCSEWSSRISSWLLLPSQLQSQFQKLHSQWCVVCAGQTNYDNTKLKNMKTELSSRHRELDGFGLYLYVLYKSSFCYLSVFPFLSLLSCLAWLHFFLCILLLCPIKIA